MEKLSAASSLSQNSRSNNKKSEKNKKILIPETIEESLENWKPIFSLWCLQAKWHFQFFHHQNCGGRDSLIWGIILNIPFVFWWSQKSLSKKTLLIVILHVGMIQVHLQWYVFGTRVPKVLMILYLVWLNQVSYMVPLSNDLNRTFSIDIKTEGYCSSDEKLRRGSYV